MDSIEGRSGHPRSVAVISQLRGTSTPARYAIVTLAIAAIGAGDWVTGHEISFSIFYMIPVMMAAWGADRGAGIGAAVGSGVAWLLADLWSGHDYSHPVIPYWNAIVRLAMFLVIAVAVARTRRAIEEQVRIIDELKTALAEVRTLTGLLPICAWCKRVRDDHGYWSSVEAYLASHTDAEFTHGICPACVPTVFRPEG